MWNGRLCLYQRLHRALVARNWLEQHEQQRAWDSLRLELLSYAMNSIAAQDVGYSICGLLKF